MEAKNIPPLMLAYIGDAVYELAVREHLLHSGMVKMDRLHSAAVAYVNASRQSQLWGEIDAVLSPEQREVFRRGRNAKSGHQPPHSTVGEYRRATGLEALIGYLHLTGDQAQLERIFATLSRRRRKPASRKPPLILERSKGNANESTEDRGEKGGRRKAGHGHGL